LLNKGVISYSYQTSLMSGDHVDDHSMQAASDLQQSKKLRLDQGGTVDEAADSVPPVVIQENAPVFGSQPNDDAIPDFLKMRVVAVGVSGAACGVGDEIEQATLVRSLNDREVAHISSSTHTLFALYSGAVLSCGSNDFAQLGRQGSESVPRVISSLDSQQVVAVAAGEGYSVLCTSNGTLFAWGKNHKGQCGTGDRVTVPKPKLVKGALATKHVIQVRKPLESV
jgi:hypothetical protein